jgi:hypothetical protein
VLALLLLGAYHLVRLAASRCTGPQCDAYIPLSLLVPILIVVAGATAGALASRDASANDRPWLIPLIVATTLGCAGPMVAVLLFRDQPDVVVVLATVLFLQAALAALAYTLRSRFSRVP